MGYGIENGLEGVPSIELLRRFLSGYDFCDRVVDVVGENVSEDEVVGMVNFIDGLSLSDVFFFKEREIIALKLFCEFVKRGSSEPEDVDD